MIFQRSILLTCLFFLVCSSMGYVPVSKWGFDATDATQCLQRALDSGTPKLLLDNVGNDWNIGPVRFPSNIELKIANGVRIRGITEKFKDTQAVLFLIANAENVTIEGGVGSEIWMDRDAFFKRAGGMQKSEWRHAVSIRGSRHIRLSGLNLVGSGGDGIYVGIGSGANPLPYSEDIRIERVICRGHYRQGMSIASVRKLHVSDCKFLSTSGTQPMCGVDFEPNHATAFLEECLFERCIFSENAASGIHFFLYHLTDTSAPISIRFRECDSFRNRGHAASLALARSDNEHPCNGRIVFEKCRLTGTVNILEARSNGIFVAFQDCSMQLFAPLSLISVSSVPIKADFSGCRINASEFPILLSAYHRPQITGNILHGKTPVDLSKWSKTCLLQDANAAASFKAGDFAHDKLKPVWIGRKVLPQGILWFRMKFSLLKHLKAGAKTSLGIRTAVIGSRGLCGKVAVISPTGETVREINVEKSTTAVAFEAEEEGIYRLECDTKGNRMSIAYGGDGWCIDARKIWFNKAKGSFYFLVPPNVRSFPVRVSGEGNERISVRIYNSEEQCVFSQDNVDIPRCIVLPRVPTSTPEAWRLEITGMVDDGYVALGLPLSPFALITGNTILSIE